jgi:hypothetical protein
MDLTAGRPLKISRQVPNVQYVYGCIRAHLRGAVVYLFLLVLLRFVGKKHVGELAPFDLLVLLILSETVQNALIGDDTLFVGGLISATTLIVLAYGMNLLTSSSKHWSRELQALGHKVRLMPPAYVRPYVKRQKNDAADAVIGERIAQCGVVLDRDVRIKPASIYH